MNLKLKLKDICFKFFDFNESFNNFHQLNEIWVIIWKVNGSSFSEFISLTFIAFNFAILRVYKYYYFFSLKWKWQRRWKETFWEPFILMNCVLFFFSIFFFSVLYFHGNLQQQKNNQTKSTISIKKTFPTTNSIQSMTRLLFPFDWLNKLQMAKKNE